MKEKRIKASKIIKITIFILVLLLAVAGVCSYCYVRDYYHAEKVSDYLAGSADVQVIKTEEGYLFDGSGEDTALIFYPGAKVEATAYAPLLYELAENGIDCFLVEMPYRLAIFGKDKADEILQNEEYQNYTTWYLAGHSLGGAMAASYTAENPDTIDALILLAAYPTKSLTEQEDLIVLSIYGSEDGVLNMESLAKGREYMPEEYIEICIEGGNHANFGSYGTQDGDGKATITAKEQRMQTIDYIAALSY
jgi:hypothetical protein